MLDLTHLLIFFISSLLPDCFRASSPSVKITHQLDSYHVCLAVLTKCNPCHKVWKKCIRHLLAGCQRTKPLSRRETEGDAAPPAKFRDDEEPRHLLSSPPGKGGVEESWKSWFTLGYFSVASVKVCSKFHPLRQTQGRVCFISCWGGQSHLLKDAFSCLQCTAQNTDKTHSHPERAPAALKHSQLPPSFYHLFALTQLSGCRLLLHSFFYMPSAIDSSAYFQCYSVSPNIGSVKLPLS